MTNWQAHHELKARDAQQSVDDLDSLNLPPRWGEVDVARQRAELVSERDEHAREAAHWRTARQEG